MNKNFGFRFLIGEIIVAAILQLIFSVEAVNPFFLATYASTINYLSYTLSAIMYLGITILIWIEIKHIEEFHIDKFSLFCFVLSTFFRRRLGINGEGFFLLVIGLAGVSTIIALVVKKPRLPRSNLRWALIGITIGIVALIPIVLIGSFLRHTWLLFALYQDDVVITLIRQIIYELSFATITEEILFRGFLWGYLSRNGWEENKILWAQGILFWLLHFSRIITPFTFFFSIPILTIISSKLRFHAKEVFPSILSHTIMNSLGVLLKLTVY